MKAPLADSSMVVVEPKPLGFGALMSALGALFGLTIRQHARGRRLWVMSVLFMLPVGIAVLARNVGAEPARADDLELILIFTLLPHALITLAALLYSSGMIQDEIEEQTMTYLLVRPIPRAGIYLTKLFATLLLTIAITAVFTTLTYVAIFWSEPNFGSEILVERIPATIAIFSMGLLVYCAIFGLISLFSSWTLVIGIAYIILFEGVLANIEFVVRQVTVMFYMRVLSMRWIGFEEGDWGIDLATAPPARQCVALLLGVGIMATLVATLAFSGREFRVKTPEGN